jgi:serine/threonine protein kinase
LTIYILEDLRMPFPAIPNIYSYIKGLTVGKCLGQGQLARVNEATLPGGRRVVIKRAIPESDSASLKPLAIDQLKDEACTLILFNHPNILPVIGTGELAGELFFATKYIGEGKTLENLLENKKHISEKQALRIIFQLASALEAVHNEGLVHIDIAPKNILISTLPDGSVEVILADCALTRPPGGEKKYLGSPGYLPEERMRLPEDPRHPEESEPEPPKKSHDIFGVGAILYEMITGGTALPGKDLRGMPEANATLGARIAQADMSEPTRELNYRLTGTNGRKIFEDGAELVSYLEKHPEMFTQRGS